LVRADAHLGLPTVFLKLSELIGLKAVQFHYVINNPTTIQIVLGLTIHMVVSKSKIILLVESL
jgi:hypothetical protein